MQLRREGPRSGEEDRVLSPGEQHRATGLIEGSDLIISTLESQFGSDVPDTEARAEELRDQARARVAVSRAFVPLTPEHLREGRQQEFSPEPTQAPVHPFDPNRTVDFIPIADMVDTDMQMPMSPQDIMQDMQGPTVLGSQQ